MSSIGQNEAKARIEKLSELPAFSRLLTDGGSNTVLRLPASIEKHLCAIETGVKRTIILFDEERLTQIRPF